jgi:hypothetical protein
MSESKHSIQRLRPVGRIECGELIFEVLPQHIRVRARGATPLPALLDIAQVGSLRGFLDRVLGMGVKQPEFDRVLVGLESTLATLRQLVTGVAGHAPSVITVDVAEIQAVIAEMRATVHDPVVPGSVRGTVEQWQTRLELALKTEAAGLDPRPAAPSQET